MTVLIDIVVYMEEMQILHYDSLNGVNKGHKYLKGTLWYLYDSDEKQEHRKPVEW